MYIYIYVCVYTYVYMYYKYGCGPRNTTWPAAVCTPGLRLFVAGLTSRVLVSRHRHVDKEALGTPFLLVLQHLCVSVMTPMPHNRCYGVINLALIGVVK